MCLPISSKRLNQSVSAGCVRLSDNFFAVKTDAFLSLKTLYFILIFLLSFFVVNTYVVTKTWANAPVVENSDQLPDGETLLLRPKVGRLIYSDDIYALKENDQLYYAFTDFIDILNLAIDYDEKTKLGAGWFLKEDWTAKIDFNTNRVTTRGLEFAVKPNDIVKKNNMVFISAQSIEEWFEIKFIPDVPQQYVEVDAPHPLPDVAKNNRRNKRFSYNNYNNDAILPRLRPQSKWFDVNTVDVRLGSRLRHRSEAANGENNDLKHNGVVSAQGHFLKHNAYVLASFDNQGGLSTAVTRLSKRDEEAVLLGPLKARSYMIGDTDITDIPLTGDARQELGFHISNSQLINAQFETTDINGDAIPGWDVELYRNGILTDSLIVDSTGRYEFPDTQLFAGDNNFELVFYGPQGEVRSREINVPVTAALLASQSDVYDISVSLSDTKTYQRDRSQDIDKGTSHIAARYNKAFGETLAYVGFRNRDIEGENKTHMAMGFSRIIKNTLIDGNFGMDDAGERAAEFTLRRNISGWDLITNALVQSEEFTPNGGVAPLKYKLATSVQRSFNPSERIRTNVFSRGEISEDYSGQKRLSRNLGGSIQTGSVSISDTLRYDTFEDGVGNETKKIDNTLSIRAIKGKYFFRGGIDYDLYPERKVDKYFAQVSYRPSNDFSTDINFDYDPDRDYKATRLNLNFTNDYFKTSPFVEIDSNNDIQAGINLNFSVVDDPNKDYFDITSKRLDGRGLVSSFVYFDKNGNKKFDAQDEPLPDVIVESVNVRRRVPTNENGYSLMNDLPTTRATDIHIDETSLPDSFMMSGFAGVSILPNAGEIVELQFPVHLAGEIDGTIWMVDENEKSSPVRRASIDLYPLAGDVEGVINVQSASDGFYVASQIPPGKYLMTVNNDTTKRTKAAAPAPKIIEIGYKGDTIYGMDLALDSTRAPVPIQVAYKKIDSPREIYRVKTDSQGESKLAGVLSEFAKKSLVAMMGPNKPSVEVPFEVEGLEDAKIASLSADIAPAAGGEGEVMPAGQDSVSRIVSFTSNDPVKTYERCLALVEKAIPCALEVIIPIQN